MNRVARNFASLGLGEAAGRLIAFAALIYVARMLGATLYGVIGVAASILLYFNQVADGGVELAGVSAVARARDNAARLASAVLVIRVTVATLLALIVALVAPLVLPDPDGRLLAAYALALPMVGASTRWVLVGLKRTHWVAAARIAGEFTALGIVLLAVHGPDDVGVVPLAFVAGVTVSSVAMVAAARYSGVGLTLAFDWSAARDLFSRSGHLVVSAFLGLVIFNFDLIFLRYARGADAAGYYHSGYTFLAFAVNVLIAYGHSVMPTFARPDLPIADKRAVYHSAIANAFVFTLPVAVGGCLLAPALIALVYGAAYAPAAAVLAWLVWVIPIAGARESAVAALLASNGERAFLRSNVITVVCNVALVLVLVPRYGLMGAAAATVATEIIRLALIAWFAVQLDYARLAVARVFKPLAAAAAMAPVVWWLAPRGLAVAIPAGALVYGAVLLAVRGARLQRGGLVELTV